MQYRAASMIAFLCLLSLITFPILSFGQNEMVSDVQSTESNAVVSQKSTTKLRKDVYQAEEDFYSVFNKLNDEKDFDVRCRYEKATGTNIKNHVCRARFITKAYERHARRNRNDLSRAANQNVDPALAEKTAQYQEKIEVLMAANPDLQAAFDRYNAARVQFMMRGEENDSK